MILYCADTGNNTVVRKRFDLRSTIANSCTCYECHKNKSRVKRYDVEVNKAGRYQISDNKED